MKKKRTKIKKSDFLRLGVLLIGVAILLYPTISNYVYEKNCSGIVADYDRKLNNKTDEEKEEMLKRAEEYNRELAKNQLGIGDAFTEGNEEDQEYMQLLNEMENGMMGHISIPKIDVLLPVYHGTREKVLQVGIGHLQETSLPIGGESTHAVLTGHRGLPSKLLFTDLDQLKKGNIFYIKILDKTLAYKVKRIQTVLPSETESLEIQEGKDYVSLVTCTPYGINSHRLIVHGERIPYDEAIEEEPNVVSNKIKIPFEIKVLFTAILILILLYVLYKKYMKKKKAKENDV